MNALRTHLLEMNETQMLRIAELLEADAAVRPADYRDADFAAEHNPLTYLAGSLRDTLATADYDPAMLHGLTL